ncbi:MAG: hypothetical protein WEC75_00130 [Dehalococcoidia bacterium]
MAATETRVRFGEVLKRLREEDVIVERGGIAVAAVIDYDAYLRLSAEAARSGRIEAVSISVPADADIARALAAMRAGGVLGDDEAEDATGYVYGARETGTRKVADADESAYSLE